MPAPGAQLQKSIFPWVVSHDLYEAEVAGDTQKRVHRNITTEEVATDYGVPEDIFLKYLTAQMAEAESCRSLPFALCMVFSYAVVCINHDPVVPISAVEESIKFDINENANFAFSCIAEDECYMGHKGVEDVNSLADFWSWLYNGFLPLMFVQSHGWSEDSNMSNPQYIDASFDYARADRGFLLKYNKIVGGIRIRQERSEVEKCKFSADPLNVFYNKSCVGGLGYERFPDFSEAKDSTDPVREQWFSIHDDLDVVLEQVNEMETSGWLDRKTRKVEIAIPCYNAEYNVYTLMTVNLFFPRGGHIWKRVMAMSTYAKWFHGLSNYIPDAIWTSCLCWITFNEAKEVYLVVRRSGIRSLAHEYLEFWNAVDWVSVLVGYFIMFLFSRRLSGTRGVNEELVALSEISEAFEQASYRTQTLVFMQALEVEVRAAYTLRIFLAGYPIIIVMRLFKAFSAQPRLGVVTKTIVTAGVDLFHFLLVFFSIFFTFVVAGAVLFGREIHDFSTFRLASITSFRIMMGDFDWGELMRVGRMEAGIWFFMFLVTIVLLLLNMLLAIVMDAYADQKEKIGDAETLWSEVAQSYRRWQGQRTGQLVSLDDVFGNLHTKKSTLQRRVQKPSRRSTIHHADSGPLISLTEDVSSYQPVASSEGVDDSHGKKSSALAATEDFVGDEMALVTIDYLRDICLKMPYTQGLSLIQKSVDHFCAEHSQDAYIEDMLTAIRKVNYRTQKLKRKIRSTVKNQRENQEDDPKEKNGEKEKEKPAHPEDGPDKQSSDGVDFTKELACVRLELKQASDWVGHADKKPSADPHDDGDHYPRPSPLSSLHETPECSIVQIRERWEDVLLACREAGISSDNDGLRVASAGKVVRVLQRDALDNTVLCKVPGVGEVWFAIGALLTHANLPPVTDAPLTSALKSNNDDLRQALTLGDVEHVEHWEVAIPEERPLLENYATSLASSSTGTLGPGFRLGAEVSNQELQGKAEGLAVELRAGRQTVTEALAAVSDLQWRLLQEHEEKGKAVAKFQLLRQKVLALTKENRRLLDESYLQDERINTVAASKDEYFNTVHTMMDENKALKEHRRPHSHEPTSLNFYKRPPVKAERRVSMIARDSSSLSQQSYSSGQSRQPARSLSPNDRPGRERRPSQQLQ